jgi:uncharacterized protein (TIGR02231 family)
MERFGVLLILFFTIPFLTNGNDNQKPVTSSIEEVTVFRSGAQITRQATVELTAGRNEIVFQGLAPSLSAQTIQLSGDAGFMILSLTHRQDYLDEHPQQERLQQLTAQRDSLQRLIQDKETSINIKQQEKNILLSNTNLKGGQQNLSVSELKQAMEYFHQKLSELETEILAIEREVSGLRTELEKIKKQINELNSSASQNSSVITAVLQSESEQQVQLTLTYLVGNAGWNPSYDIRVDDTEGPVNLSYKANVYQSTGVDWNDIQLEISSSIPDRGGALPQLFAWGIDFTQPAQDPVRFKSETGSEQMRAAVDQRQQENRPMPVEQIENQTSFSYRIDLPYDVSSGGKPLAVEINREELPAAYRYYTVPKRRNAAYLTAQITNWDQYNLLPGDANLFFENTYVGRSSIDPRSVGDTLSVSLGQDQSIVTDRTKLKEFEEKNFFGNKVRESRAWEISVRNTKDRPIYIEVMDQIPVSQNEDIKVSLKRASGANVDSQTGMLTWQFQLGAGEVRNLQFEFEVEYPRGKQVNF